MTRSARQTVGPATPTATTRSPVLPTVLGLGAIALTLLTVGKLGLALWNRPAEPELLDALAVVLDPSKTVVESERCEGLEAVAVRHLDGARQDAMVAVYAMQESQTGNVEHLATLRKERRAFVFEDAHGNETEAADRAGFLSELDQLCRGLAKTNESPIKETLEEVLTIVKAAGCNDSTDLCSVIYIGDGIEDRDPAMKRRLRDREATVTKVDNTGIPVELCGTGDRNVKKADAYSLGDIRRVWQEAFEEAPIVLAECATFEL